MKQQGYMLETPSMHRYASRDNPCAAGNQQGRPEREPSTTTCPAPKKRKRFTLRDNPGYSYDKDRKRWLRTVQGGLAWCCDCRAWKSVDSFAVCRGVPYHYCKQCQRLHKAMYRYRIDRDTAVRLYAVQTCECCGSSFVKQQHKHIHHVNDCIIGVVCLTCNHILRDESSEHLRRLRCCVAFIQNRVKI